MADNEWFLTEDKWVQHRNDFAQAGAFDRSFRGLAVKTPELENVWNAYIENMNRVHSHWFMVSGLASAVYQFKEDTRRLNLHGGVIISKPPPATPEEAEHKRLIDEQNKIFQKYPHRADYGHDALAQAFQLVVTRIPGQAPQTS